MVVDNGYAYLFTEGEGLHIINVSTPELPLLAGEYLENPFDQYDGAILHNSYLYFCADGDIHILDVNDVEQPTFVTTYPSPGNDIQGLAVSGDLLYAVGEHFGIQISDISDPENPEQVGWNDVFYGCKSILIQGDIAFIPCGVGGFRSVNISNPEDIRQMDVLGGDYRHAVIQGEIAYLTASLEGILYAATISNADEITIIGESEEDIPGIFYGLAGNGDYVYVCNGSQGMRIFDISTPETPSLSNTYSFNNIHVGSAYSLPPIVHGNSLFIADEENHLMVYDITDPVDLSLAGNLTYNPRFSTLVLDESTIRLHDINQGLIDFDVQNPTSPNRTDMLYLSTGDLKQMANHNGYLILSNLDELLVYNNHDLINSWEMTDDITALCSVNNGLFVALQTGKVVSLDLSDIQSPSPVDSIDLPGFIPSLTYNDPYLQVCSYNGQLTLLEVDEDYNFVQVGQRMQFGMLTSSTGLDGYVYCARDSSRIEILDIEDPENIIVVDDFMLNGIHKLKIYDGYLIGLAKESGFRIYSLDNFELPALVGSYDTPGEPHDMLVEGEYAYLADGEYFEVFDVSGAILTNQLTVTLRANYYNLVCTPYTLPALDAIDVFGDIAGLQIVYGEDGSIFLPPEINTIGDIDPSRAWQVFTTENTNWRVGGEAISLETQYLIAANRWNWIGHPFTEHVDVEEVFPDDAEEVLTVLIADNGDYWIPSLGINTLEVLSPGRGLIAHSYEDFAFLFEAADEGALTHIYEDTHNENSPTHQTDFARLVHPTGKPYPVVLKFDQSFSTDQSVSVHLYDGSELVGYYDGMLDSELLPLIAWEKTHDGSNYGFTQGNPITVELYDESVNLKCRTTQGTFGKPPYALIDLEVEIDATTPSNFAVVSLSPNPFNDKTTLTFFLPESGEVSISISNLLGQTVYKDVSKYNSGKQNFLFTNADNLLSSGLYFVKVRYGSNVWAGKLLYLR